MFSALELRWHLVRYTTAVDRSAEIKVRVKIFMPFKFTLTIPPITTNLFCRYFPWSDAHS